MEPQRGEKTRIAGDGRGGERKSGGLMGKGGYYVWER